MLTWIKTAGKKCGFAIEVAIYNLDNRKLNKKISVKKSASGL